MTQYKAVVPSARRAGAAVLSVLLAGCATQPRAVPATFASSEAVPAYEAPIAPGTVVAERYAPVTDREALRGSSPGLRDDAPLRYVVKKGDTLWGIATRYLADAWQWPELWYVNGKLANPHRIYPGDVLELYNVNGRTVLARGEDLERLSPQVRESSLGEGLPAIPIDAIRDFLNGPRVVDLATLNAAPYLLAFADDRLLGFSGIPVYIKNVQPGEETVYSTVRKGQTYTDPDTGALLGYEALPTGEVEIRKFGAPSVGVMIKSLREVMAGDRLLSLEGNRFTANFYPHAPAQPVSGRIISLYDAVSQSGQFQIVAINRGSEHGLEVGHILTILKANKTVKDPVTGKKDQLPKESAGLLMVFKTMQGLSYGLVMSATRGIHVLDHVEKPSPDQE